MEKIKNSNANLIALLVLIGFSLSIIYHSFLGEYTNFSYPFNTFLFTPLDKFRDFYTLLESNNTLNPYLGKSPGAQYPFMNFVTYIFSIFNHHLAFYAYTGFISGSIAFFCSAYTSIGRLATVANILAVALLIHPVLIIIRNCNFWSLSLVLAIAISYYFLRERLNVFIITLLTYPFLFTIDRGNFESLLVLCIIFFLYFYQRERNKAAALFLAFAIAMKIYPVVMIFLPLAERKYRVAFYAVAFAVALTFISLLSFHGGILENLSVLTSGQNISQNQILSAFLGNNRFVQRGVTLFTFCKIIFNYTGHIKTVSMVDFLAVYKIAAVSFFALVAAYVAFVEKELWRRVALLVFSMLLLPHISADYKLLHVLLPVLLFISVQKQGQWDRVYSVLFALLLIPKDYYYLPGIISDGGVGDISIAVLLNPLIMLCMMLMIMISGCLRSSSAQVCDTIRCHLNTSSAFLMLNRKD